MKLEECVEMVQEIADMTNGDIDSMGFFDNHGYATISYPLPKNHWIYQKNPVDPPDRIYSPITNELRHDIIESAKWAIRAATDSGRIEDFDPDAILQNILFAFSQKNHEI
jgi:hypothetical protein